MDPLLQQVVDGTTLNNDYSFVDADTVRDKDGQTYRLQGVDAPELAKWINDPNNPFKAGTAGGATATQYIQQLAREQGFTNVVKTGQMGAFGRPEVRLENDKGESFTTRLLQSGVLDATEYTTDRDLAALAVADLYDEGLGKPGEDAFNDAARVVNDAIANETRGDLQFKRAAVNELDRVMNPGTTTTNVEIRSPDRDIDNNALNPFSEAWDTGVTGVVEAGYGFASLLGDTVGLEGLKSLGNEGSARARARVQENAKFLTDYKDVNSFGTAIEFLGNNLAMSLPYMGVIMAGSAVGGVTGLAAPAAMYAGQVWNEQESDKKNAAWAIGGGIVQAAVDRLGLDILLGKVAPKQAYSQALKELTKKVGKEQAEIQLSRATRLEMAKLAGDAATVAKDQIAKKRVVMDMLKGAGVGAAGEGLTEAFQESVGYLSANHGSVPDWGDLQERMIAAVVAGGSLGGAFGVGGVGIDKAGWADVAWRQAPADAAEVSAAGRFADQEKEIYGYVPTIQELNAETRQAPDAIHSVDERAERDKKAKKDRSTMDVVVDTIASAPGLWRGATRYIFTPEIQGKSRAARILADMFGANLQRTFSGSNLESWKHHQVTKYKNSIAIPEKFWAERGVVGRQAKEQESRRIYAAMKLAWKDGKFNKDALPPEYKQLGQQLNDLGNQMWSDQKAYNKDLGYIDNYLGRFKTFNKKAINDNQQGFISRLMKDYNMDATDARNVTDAILDNQEVGTIEEAFEVTKGTAAPGSHKKRTLNLSENENFQEFMEQDIFANVSQAAKSATRFQAYEQFVGKNGANVAKLLDQMEREGVASEVVDKVAAQLKNYLDAESGNYKRPTTEVGKKMVAIQKNFLFVTMVAGLGLSTVSSLPELAMTVKGLTPGQLKDIGSVGRKMAKEIWSTAQQGASAVVTQGKGFRPDTANQASIRELGYYDWDVGAATTTGVTEIGAGQAVWAERFFRWIGLQGYTNMTRAIRSSFAGDFMRNHFDTINQMDPGKMTNHDQEAVEAIRALGMDPHRMAKLWQQQAMGQPLAEADNQFFADQIREGTYNFINEAIALPGTANRPLIFQDPRFAMFTQFQGFISTMTSTIIPKMWGEYIRRGSPAMTYATFSTMAMMIALGFASQELKDQLKYGESSPYLDDAEWYRRGAFSSGLLGTGERVIDTLFPIYDKQSRNAGEWIFNETTGQSPALSNLASIGSGVGDLVTGNTEQAANKFLRTVPFIAPVSGLRKDVARAIGDWNFDGGE